MENIENKKLLKLNPDLYPLTIISDRYGGCYSGGNYLAFNLDFDEIPDEVSGDDISCFSFWNNTNLIVGKGDTIEDAVIDLQLKLHFKDRRRN